MKKLVLASAMALASVALVVSPTLRAQNNSGQITIQDPAEFNAYQNASTQSDPAAKAKALEAFITQYPNSVVKKAVLDQLMDVYQQANNPDQALSAATRLLEVDPSNFKALYYSVYLKKTACQKNVDPATGESKDPQTCDDAAALARKGLTATKPAGTSDDDWKKMTGAVYPIFHSGIAVDDVIAKKDYAAAIKEYNTELMLFTPAQTQGGPGLVDTLNLAEAYTKAGDSRDEVKACWYYARAWNFAPPAYKAQIEPKLEYWYKRYHGNLDGINDVKTQSASTVFPPATFTITPAPTPPEIVHGVITSTPDLTKLNLEDKEFILANGNKDDAQKLWGILQGQMTPVPGIVISDPASALKVSIAGATSTAKPKEYVVKLTNPVAWSAVPAPPAAATGASALTYLEANGVAADVSAIVDLDKAKKVTIEPAVSTVNVAVTQDAKDNKTPDFLVNLKEPLSCKDAPVAGVELKLQPTMELDATYSTYTTIPAVGATPAKAQIVLNEGFVQPEKKATAPVHHKPAAGAAAHHPGA